MKRILVRFLAIGSGLVWVALWPSIAASEDATQAWDQEKVTAIAAGFAESVKGIENALRGELAAQMPTGDRRSRYQTKQNLRRLRAETRQLARELEKGSGHDETIDIFLQIQEITHSAANNAKRAMLTQPTLDEISKAREHIIQLAPYYGETWVPVLSTP